MGPLSMVIRQSICRWIVYSVRSLEVTSCQKNLLICPSMLVKPYANLHQSLFPFASEPPRQLPALAVHRLVLYLLCPAFAQILSAPDQTCAALPFCSTAQGSARILSVVPLTNRLTALSVLPMWVAYLGNVPS